MVFSVQSIVGALKSYTRRPFFRQATLRRSLFLLRIFPQEQSNPEFFYSELAKDTASLVASFAGDLGDKTVIDVGGGPGFFAQSFLQAGARYFSVDPDVPSDFMSDSSFHVVADGNALPFSDGCADIVLSSNVAEHVSTPWVLADELLRITKPGGLLFFSYTAWWGPFGGHETGWWHYRGGHWAAQRYRRIHGKAPKNQYGRTLFRVNVSEGLQWAQGHQHDATVVAQFPRYHPWWAWWLVRIPVIRECAVSNLMVVLRKSGQ